MPAVAATSMKPSLAPPEIVLASEFSSLRVALDGQTGGPVRVWDDSTGLDVSAAVVLREGGGEVRGPAGGLSYPGTTDVAIAGPAGPLRERVLLDGRQFVVPVATTQPERWSLEWRYELREEWPRLCISLAWCAGADDAIARNIELDLEVELPERDAWRVHAPGCMLRPGVTVALLPDRLEVLPISGVSGGIGVTLLEAPDAASTVVLWPVSTSEIGDVGLVPTPAGVRSSWVTDVAGQPGSGGQLVCSGLNVDVLPCTARALIDDLSTPLDRWGLTSPADPPAWVRTASIYEVQIGFSVFWGEHRYSPYPTVTDVIADLDRIADLGFTALQIMPRQPYPSYNVVDYTDIDTTYGDEDDLRELVRLCHRRGMQVIFDVLMHGVVDGESIEAAVEAIRSGPFADRLDEVVGDITKLEAGDDGVAITWSRHILDFEPYWVGGSARRHPLTEEHPEWFCRDSSGNIPGMYTKAFDCAHPGWQRHFVDSLLALARRLDADGFRLDAPTYNYFHNWSERTRANAAASMMGCFRAFEMLRRELRAERPSALLYTEPSGLLHRRAMDLNYNYDELFLVDAVLRRGSDKPHWVRNARDLIAWFAERDACLPRGALTAHHIDSHDTFWWPEWGSKWRREQYGIDAARALMTVFALSGGPYMTFVGGEIGMEAAVRAVNHLRVQRPHYAAGASLRGVVSADSDDVYAIVRASETGQGLVLAELGGSEREVTIRLEGIPFASGDEFTASDALGGRSIQVCSDGNSAIAVVALAPFECLAIELPDPAPSSPSFSKKPSMTRNLR